MAKPQNQRLIVSTTTSLYETGLLDVLETEFEKKHSSIDVAFLSQGTGLAIQTAMRGDADMILVHDPARELKFLQDGYGVNRKVIAYNFFVIVGPKEDPVGINGLSPVQALTKIKGAGENGSVEWVSRGDDSGTHTKEKRLWTAGGFSVSDLREKSWYLEAGQGMTATLKLTDEKLAYTLCDLGSYLNNYKKGNIQLEVLVEEGEDTLNVYSAIANNPKHCDLSGTSFNASIRFLDFLISEETQEILADFGNEEFDSPLFNPYIPLLASGSNPEMLQWIQELAYFDGTECPQECRYQEGDLYR
ncbi:substrate-binding domain-containing protein [Candidatus Bathyarchaeota archaeon]|nr:substrate-binding domain-containing protein [Candidatus Bathyarchaeota archaeon]